MPPFKLEVYQYKTHKQTKNSICITAALWAWIKEKSENLPKCHTMLHISISTSSHCFSVIMQEVILSLLQWQQTNYSRTKGESGIEHKVTDLAFRYLAKKTTQQNLLHHCQNRHCGKDCNSKAFPNAWFFICMKMLYSFCVIPFKQEFSASWNISGNDVPILVYLRPDRRMFRSIITNLPMLTF